VKGAIDILAIGDRVRQSENWMKDFFGVLTFLLNVEQVTFDLMRRLEFEPGHPLISSRVNPQRDKKFVSQKFFVLLA
jgi:hypothetical protein